MQFETLLESYYKRMNAHGFSPGDEVVLKKNAASHPYVKAGNHLYQDAIKKLVEDNVRLTLLEFDLDRQIPINVMGLFVKVAPQIGPNWTSQESFVLPTDLLDLSTVNYDVFQNKSDKDKK